MKRWHVLLAHGSRDEEWRLPFEQLTSYTQGQLGSAVVRLAFLQLAEPTLERVAEAAVREGARQITVLPLFMAQGRHVTVDIETLVDEPASRYLDVEFELRAPIGSDSRLWALLRDLVIENISHEASR